LTHPSRIPDPGVKKAPDPGSATLDLFNVNSVSGPPRCSFIFCYRVFLQKISSACWLEVSDGEEEEASVHQTDQQHNSREHQKNNIAVPSAPIKRSRCKACYREAANRRIAQAVKRVRTRCLKCEKHFCVNHLRLYCDGCNASRLSQVSRAHSYGH
jgi:hypothetical protein